MIIAVDFDGTLAYHGRPNSLLFERLIAERQCGNRVVLWTTREGPRLREAVEFCKKNGLYFDAVNRNVPEALRLLGHDSRKIYADLYIDDKSIKP